MVSENGPRDSAFSRVYLKPKFCLNCVIIQYFPTDVLTHVSNCPSEDSVLQHIYMFIDMIMRVTMHLITSNFLISDNIVRNLQRTVKPLFKDHHKKFE